MAKFRDELLKLANPTPLFKDPEGNSDDGTFYWLIQWCHWCIEGVGQCLFFYLFRCHAEALAFCIGLSVKNGLILFYRNFREGR